MNYEHAYTLLRLYCEKYAGGYTHSQINRPIMYNDETRVASALQNLLATLRAKEKWNVGGVASFAVRVLGTAKNQRYIHPLEAAGLVYDILGVVTYINENVWAKNNLFFFREESFQSPRATTADRDDGGRTTPTDRRGLRSLLAQLQLSTSRRVCA